MLDPFPFSIICFVFIFEDRLRLFLAIRRHRLCGVMVNRGFDKKSGARARLGLLRSISSFLQSLALKLGSQL